MKTKRKSILLAICACALVAVSVLGTMAYLTSKDEVKNTFTVGNVEIKLDEAKVDGDGKAITGEGAERVKNNSYKLVPGAKLDKDPTVTVAKDSEKSYVRMLVTINKKSALDKIGIKMTDVFEGYNAGQWIFTGQKDNNDDTMTYEFRYKNAVPETSSDTVLPPLFTGIKVPDELNNQQLASLKDLNIKVIAEAVQADGFADEEEAFSVLNNS
ncbi:MAG: SipW-dependent-type signal peptide-containing protein [Oscillospiraceae bacterium]